MAAKGVFERYESGVQSYARAFPRVFKRASGAQLWDVQGRLYLDFLAGAGSLNYGHNNPELKRVLLEYITRDAITHSLDLHTEAKGQFLEALQDIILKPRGLDYVVQFTGPTGANAVEAALKIARKVTGRTNIICFTNGFHGVSIGALAACGNRYHRGAAGLPLQGTTTMPFDGYFGADVNTIDYLDRMLSDPSSGIDAPAAVIIETIQGEGGINVASNAWLQQLQTLCRDKDILLIVDDIQAGCGRTGTFFSFERAGLKPDIVTLSKSLSGYGLPFSIVLLRRSVDQWKPGEHNGTFRGNNHAFVTSTAMLKHYWTTTQFAESVHEKGEWLAARLQDLVNSFPSQLTEARGLGMMRGVHCADPKRAAAVSRRAFSHGLIMERSGPFDEVLKCLMPLTISSAELAVGLDILETACSEEFAAKRGVSTRVAATSRRTRAGKRSHLT